MINILYITLFFTIVIDVLRFPQELSKMITRILTKGKVESENFFKKPFSCSTCMSFWTCLLYIILTHNLTIVNLFLIVLISSLTTVFSDLYYFITDHIKKLLSK